jgi:hypothetical protein
LLTNEGLILDDRGSFVGLKFSQSFCHFLLAQKVIPAGNRKKGTLPNASARKASALLSFHYGLGKEASPLDGRRQA